MSISTKHPQYRDIRIDWETMRDTHAGERKIKEEGQKYLPPTSGMVANGVNDLDNIHAPGYQAYQAYKMRAQFPDIVFEAVEALLGIMHHKPATIELPSVMEPLLEKATIRNESLQMLLRRINEEQLITGRCGILAEPVNGTTAQLPYIALYQAEHIINWDDGNRDGIAVDNLNLVVLDESEDERTDVFTWENKTKYRVLVLGGARENEPMGQGVYRQGVFREQDANFNEADLIDPSIRGNTLNEIPFVFINSKDIVAMPDKPPLLGLANLVLTIYRGEADYRQALFMQGQDTLVVIGGDEKDKYQIGAGASLTVPIGGDAKFIGVESAGLAEMRLALENDHNRASQKGGQLMDSVSRERESGDALRIRVAARTSSLNQIALTGAYGLQENLRQIARWIGANPEEVNVTPNTDFIDDQLGGEELVRLMTAKSMGAPLSARSIHKLEQDKGLTEFDYEKELEEIEDEVPMAGGTEGLAGMPAEGIPEETEDDDETRAAATT